jgi:hypothetical protein
VSWSPPLTRRAVRDDRCGDGCIFGHGAKGVLAADPRILQGFLRQSVEWHLSGDHGGRVYFAVVAGGDTGIVSGAVLVEAAGTVIFRWPHQVDLLKRLQGRNIGIHR